MHRNPTYLPYRRPAGTCKYLGFNVLHNDVLALQQPIHRWRAIPECKYHRNVVLSGSSFLNHVCTWQPYIVQVFILSEEEVVVVFGDMALK